MESTLYSLSQISSEFRRKKTKHMNWTANVLKIRFYQNDKCWLNQASEMRWNENEQPDICIERIKILVQKNNNNIINTNYRHIFCILIFRSNVNFCKNFVIAAHSLRHATTCDRFQFNRFIESKGQKWKKMKGRLWSTWWFFLFLYWSTCKIQTNISIHFINWTGCERKYSNWS